MKVQSDTWCTLVNAVTGTAQRNQSNDMYTVAGPGWNRVKKEGRGRQHLNKGNR